MQSNLPPGFIDDILDDKDEFLNQLLSAYSLTQEEWDILLADEQDKMIKEFCEDEEDYTEKFEEDEVDYPAIYTPEFVGDIHTI